MKYLFFIVLLVGCKSEMNRGDSPENSTYDMDCLRVGNGFVFLQRCENSEVICYIQGRGISCRLKDGV